MLLMRVISTLCRSSFLEENNRQKINIYVFIYNDCSYRICFQWGDHRQTYVFHHRNSFYYSLVINLHRSLTYLELLLFTWFLRPRFIERTQKHKTKSIYWNKLFYGSDRGGIDLRPLLDAGLLGAKMPGDKIKTLQMIFLRKNWIGRRRFPNLLP